MYCAEKRRGKKRGNIEVKLSFIQQGKPFRQSQCEMKIVTSSRVSSIEEEKREKIWRWNRVYISLSTLCRFWYPSPVFPPPRLRSRFTKVNYYWPEFELHFLLFIRCIQYTVYCWMWTRKKKRSLQPTSSVRDDFIVGYFFFSYTEFTLLGILLSRKAIVEGIWGGERFFFWVVVHSMKGKNNKLLSPI